MAKAGGVTVDWLLNGSAAGGGSKRDRAWQAALAALRIVWRDPQRRRVAVAVLTALVPAWRQRSRPGSGGPASRENVPPRTLLVLLAVALWTLTAGPARAEPFRGKVISVADGDTTSVLHDGRAEPIRLNGIDAPENGQPFSHRARQFTFQLASGQVVTVRRTVADVLLPDGRSLNHEIVRAGFAWWYRRYSTDQTLAALEAEARAARRGLWADPNPVPPWEWRQTQHELPAVPRQPPSVAPSSPTPAGGPIIGNKRSGIYHRPDCPNYGDVSPQNRVPFATLRGALQDPEAPASIPAAVGLNPGRPGRSCWPQLTRRTSNASPAGSPRRLCAP